MRINTSNIASVSLLLAASFTGCAKPQAGAENVELISSLRTAVSAQNPEWLEANVKAINERHAGGHMSDSAHEAFQAIIEKAQAGEWKEAEQDAIAFQKAQRPTDEQMGRTAHHDH